MIDVTETLTLLAISAYNQYTSLNYGINASPIQKQRYELTINPQPGHYVLETSTIGIRLREHKVPVIGRLILERSETFKERDNEYDGEPPTFKFWYLEDFDGNLQRWTNCSFIRVFESIWPGREDEDKGIYTFQEKLDFWVRDALFRHGKLIKESEGER